MSYILEALADSEQSRLRVATAPKYSLLPAVGEKLPHNRRWPYVVAAAMLVNVAVLQVWLRPALPGGVASNKMPTVLQAAESQHAAEPRIASPARSESPAADVADIAPREVSPPWSQPERVADRRAVRLSAPANVDADTVSANPANESAPVRIPKLAASVTAKRNAEVAVASEAKPAPATAKMNRSTEVNRSTAAATTLDQKPAPTAAKVNRSTEVNRSTVAAATSDAKPTPATSVAKRGAQIAEVTEATPTPALTSPTQPSPTSAAGTAEMPPALQQEMPALSVAGFIRDEGSGSLVIVNDRLVREGDEVAPGVKLEKILNDSLVFEYKGYRFKR
jgi:general secretion pathway protein B